MSRVNSDNSPRVLIKQDVAPSGLLGWSYDAVFPILFLSVNCESGLSNSVFSRLMSVRNLSGV